MITVSTRGNALVVVVAGRFDVMDVVAFRNEISRAVEQTDLAQVVVDVSGARLGPRALATLVDEKTLLVRRGGDLLVVCGAAHDGIDRIFPCHSSVEAALRSLPS